MCTYTIHTVHLELMCTYTVTCTILQKKSTTTMTCPCQISLHYSPLCKPPARTPIDPLWNAAGMQTHKWAYLRNCSLHFWYTFENTWSQIYEPHAYPLLAQLMPLHMCSVKSGVGLSGKYKCITLLWHCNCISLLSGQWVIDVPLLLSESEHCQPHPFLFYITLVM